MSDTQPSPDWWQASDGKWYPPPRPDWPPAPSPQQWAAPAGAPAWPQSGMGGQQWTPSPVAQTTSGKATAALVLSILSFAVCPVVPAIVALVLSSSAMTEIRQSGGAVGGEGLVKAARIISWIHLALVAVGILLIAIVVAVAPDSFDDPDRFQLGLALLR
jgi:hypothetical protein